ncbi:hypothetical protein [Kitasatospora sp. NPDC057198]|uniref:hypothetical protein n=1 Tax=Kitasatospora sp. NPDC057198 TaxID=3346046 RepID=UPI003631F581
MGRWVAGGGGEVGEEVARCLLELIDEGRAPSRPAGTPVLVPRGSTGPAAS